MSTTNFTTLKALRMWHWRKLLEWRKYATDWEEKLIKRTRLGLPTSQIPPQIANCHRHANEHLSAVQVLNDSLPGTAEQDCAAEASNG